MLITTQNLGNFNPRSHERSDGRREAEQRETLISIHAPTRGATKARGADNGVTIISIHAPTRGATALVLSLRPLQMYFNPRSHERSDFQSKHFFCFFFYFNPRSHERSDGAPIHGKCLNFQFQSTLPREERRILWSSIAGYLYFNPRSHERSDSNIAQKICLFLYNTDNKYIIR